MAEELRARIQEMIAPLRVKPGRKVRLPKDFDPGYSTPELTKEAA